MNRNAIADTNDITPMEENCAPEQYNGAEDVMVRITVLNIYKIVPKQVGNGAAVLECKGNGGRTIHQQGFGHNKLRGDRGSSEY